MNVKHDDPNGAVLVLSADELALIGRSLRHEANAVEAVALRYLHRQAREEAQRLRSLADLVYATRCQHEGNRA